MSDGAAERDRLAADIAALAGFPRDSCGPGERRSAQWIAGRLRETAGVEEIAVEPYRGVATYAYEQLAHAAAGWLGGRLVALGALASLELHLSGRAPWLRRVLPKREGANVVARIAPADGGAVRRTLVLVAHHDAARTGLIWSRAFTEPGAEARLRRRAMDRRALPFAAGLALRALGGRAGRLGRLLLALTAAGLLDVATSRTVPGADDNASGVAGVLALAARYGSQPLEDVEVVLALTGGEESGMHGMAAFLRDRAATLDPATTFVLGLDTLGSGTPVVLTGEATLLRHAYRPRDVARVPEHVERWMGGAWTDPILAVHAGLPAISMLSVGPAGVHARWHVMDDTPAHVELDCVQACLAAADAVARAL